MSAQIMPAHITITAGVSVTSSPEQERYAALNREATQAKKRGDWAEAVRLLQEAKAIQGEAYEDTRLAKFLQQAGHPDQALAEIDWLVAHSQARASRYASPGEPAALTQYMRTAYLAGIYKDAALICRRAGWPERQAQYAQLQARYDALRQRLQPLAGVDW